jgi:hypothetical protein
MTVTVTVTLTLTVTVTLTLTVTTSEQALKLLVTLWIASFLFKENPQFTEVYATDMHVYVWV